MRKTTMLGLGVCLAALAGIASGQGCACATYEPSVTITISEGTGNAARVDRTRVCVTKGGEVVFRSDEGDFEINFNKGDGTPFTPALVQGRRSQRSATRIARGNRDNCGKSYRYTVLLRKGGRNLSLDPEIIVEPGGEGN
jgi:hypothetical protein